MNRMTKFLMSSALVLALGGFLGGPAMADVTVTANIIKDKDKFIFEFIGKLKVVVILVDAHIHAQAAAESEAIKNQVNKHNFVDLDFVGAGGANVTDARDALIDHSVRDEVGITQFNQDVGNMVNQANVVSLALTEPDPLGTDTAVTDAQASQEQINKHNTVIEFGRLNLTDPDYESILDHSVRDNLGITQVNQNSGNMNNQDNNVSVALGLANSAVVALSEADLGQVNKHNFVDSTNTVKVDTILWSVNNNTGITSVNQTSGNMNNQDTSISFAANAGPATLASNLSFSSF